MTLIRHGRRADDDPWIVVGDDDDLPEGPVVVSLGRWRAERDQIARRNSPLGVRLRSDEAPEDIAGDLDRLDLVMLEFPAFTDGRPYSSARLLRERFGFDGEIRAVGNVLRDQFLFMLRCGFDAIDAAKEADAEAWHEAVNEIGVFYQPTGDGRAHAAALRGRRVPTGAH